MREVLDNLKCDVYNGEKCYCMTSEEMLNAMKELAKKEEQELQKYKSLYENEKEHTDTLKRIIKKVIDKLEFHENDFEANLYAPVNEILCLLREIK